jgi:signal transduction histidine kinase
MRRAGWWAGLGIRTKLAILIEVAMLALGAATGVIATSRQRTMLEGELRRRGLAIAADLATFAVRPLLAGDLATLRRFVNHAMSQDYVRYASVLDPDGLVVMHSSLAEVGARPADALTRTALASRAAGWSASTLQGRGEPVFDIFAPVTASGARLGTVVLGYSRTAVETEIAQARRQILLVGLVAAVLAGGLAYLLSSYISIPIMRIAGAMGAAARGDLRVVLPVGRSDEVGILASSFNTMAEDLSRHRRHLEELVAARTSELRSANASLEREVADRTRAEQDLRESRQQLRALASHLQSVREQERTDIAREVHDELGQALTVLKMDVHWLSQRVGATPGLTDKTRAMSDTIDTTVQAVRRISAQLRPRLLDDLGLSAAIEWQAREFEERSGIQCDVRSDPEDIVLDRDRTTALFRIFQETITNVARHAGASRVDVLLRRLPDEVDLTVTDDGRGITAEQAADARSLGIAGMRERALALGGSVEIAGLDGAGTTVHVRIPV